MVSCDLFAGPNGEALFLLVGEGHVSDVFKFVKTAMNYYKNHEQLLHHTLPSSPALHILPEIKGPLLFPGKVACSNVTVQDEEGAHNRADNNNDRSVARKLESDNNNSISKGSNNLSVSRDGRRLERLAVSDTGHNRIIIFNTRGGTEVIAVHKLPGIYLLQKKRVTLKLQNCTFFLKFPQMVEPKIARPGNSL